MKILDFYLPAGKKEQGFFLMGCQHWGCPQCDTRAIKRDLRLARARGDRVLMVGDNLDAILWGDPRYEPHVVDKQLVFDDAIDRLVNEYVKFLLPYADVIDVIGDGNHEYQLNKRYKTNLIRRVVERLNWKAGTNIRYGGFVFYAIYRFKTKSYGKAGTGETKDFNILGFHGKGVGAIVTKGMIDVNRLRDAGFIYDLMFFAHKHKDFATSNVFVIPHISKKNGQNFLEVRKTKETQVGTYKKNYIIDGSKTDKNTVTWEEMKVFGFSIIGGKRAVAKLIRARKFKMKDNVRNYEFRTKVEI